MENEKNSVGMPSTDHTRKCHVVKRPDEEFEFFLRVDEARQGQIITSITPEGPADRAGLKNGDRLIEVNGKNVERKNHAEVVELIRESMPKNEIKFEVVDEDHDSNKNTAKSKTNGEVSMDETELKPRICKITKKRSTFGFHLEAHGNDKPGHFIKEVVDGGPAVESGLRSGDRIIEVGGTHVEKMPHAKVVAHIKKSGNKVTLLVADDATYKHFVARKKRIKAKHAYSSSDVVSNRSASTGSAKSDKGSISSPIKSVSSITEVAQPSGEEKARLIHVVKATEKGYGFFLRVRKGEQGEYIGDLEQGKSGEKCGLMEDDRLVAVNGEVIINKPHSEVVELIKSIPDHVIFLVVGPKAVEKAKANGVLSTLIGAKERLIEKPRHVKLHKADDGYGFYLKVEVGKPSHIVADVGSGSSADRAGLQDGEVVASVEGDDVMYASHEECVKKIKAAGDSVELLVAPRETIDVMYSLGIAVTKQFLDNWPNEANLAVPDLADFDGYFGYVAYAVVNKKIKAVAEDLQENSEQNFKPRLCKLVKLDGGFGFFLRDDGAHLLGNVEDGGAAEIAGVKENDQIIEVNGINVEKENHDEVVDRIRNSGDEVSFLVVNEEEKNYFLLRNIAITSALLNAVSSATEEDEDHPRPRYCPLTRNQTGFGFHLNGENGVRSGQYIRQVVDDGPGAAAGLRDGDRVIEVNDVNICQKSHDDVVGMIKASGSQVNFLVVDEEADLYYKNKGIEITKSLAIAMKVAELKERSDTHSSSSSSVIEAEATVHADPDDDQDKIDPPVMTFPPPPPAEQLEEQVTDMIDDAINEIREHEEREELKEDIVEEIKEAAAEEIREEIVDEIKDEVVEEIREEVREEVVEQLAEDAVEEIKEDIREEILEEVKEEIKEAIVEDIVEDIGAVAAVRAAEELKEEMMERIREEERQRVREELRQEMLKEAAEEAAAKRAAEEEPRKIAEEAARRAAEEEKERRAALEAARRAVEEEAERRATEEAARRAAEEEEAATRRAFEEAARKAAEEAAAKKAAQQTARPAPIKIVAAAAVANAIVNNATENQEERKTVKPSFSSARAMFERNQPEQPYKKPSWQRTSVTSAKQTVSATQNRVKSPSNPTEAPTKQQTGPMQTSWSGSGMSLSIVETSSVFN